VSFCEPGYDNSATGEVYRRASSSFFLLPLLDHTSTHTFRTRIVKGCLVTYRTSSPAAECNHTGKRAGIAPKRAVSLLALQHKRPMTWCSFESVAKLVAAWCSCSY